MLGRSESRSGEPVFLPCGASVTSQPPTHPPAPASSWPLAAQKRGLGSPKTASDDAGSSLLWREHQEPILTICPPPHCHGIQEWRFTEASVDQASTQTLHGVLPSAQPDEQVYLQFTGERGSPKWALGPHSPDAQLLLVLVFSRSQLYPTLCDLMDCSTQGFPVLHQLPELAQTHVRVSDAIQSSRPLRPLLLLPSIFPSIRVFSNESALCIRWPKYWSFSFSPSNEYLGLISYRIDCFDLLAVQGTLSSAQYCLVLSKSLHLSGPWLVHLISKMYAIQGFFIWVHRFLRDPWKG